MLKDSKEALYLRFNWQSINGSKLVVHDFSMS